MLFKRYRRLDLFDESLESLKYFTLMYCSSDHYAGSREDILEELNLILKEIKLTDKEEQEVMDAKIKWEADTEVQYDCQDGGCHYDY